MFEGLLFRDLSERKKISTFIFNMYDFSRSSILILFSIFLFLFTILVLPFYLLAKLLHSKLVQIPKNYSRVFFLRTKATFSKIFKEIK
jgi:hypothetical protein